MKRLLALGMTVLLALALAPAAAADEISDQLEKGLKLYKQGELSQAIGEIEFALARSNKRRPRPWARYSPSRPPAGPEKSPRVPAPAGA